MKRLLLTSHGIDSDKIRNKILELVSNPEDKKVCMIPTASEEWKEKSRTVIRATEELKNLGFKVIDYIDVEFDDSIKIKDYDLIYIPGGNPFYLLFHLKSSGADVMHIPEQNVIIKMFPKCNF